MKKQYAGYAKGHKSILDNKGLRKFRLNLLKPLDDTYSNFFKINIYNKNDQSKGYKYFHGKTPKEVAKKAITELCRIMAADEKGLCTPVTYTFIRKREEDVMNSIKNETDISIKEKFNGTFFELVDDNNKKKRGVNREYKYYGDRVMAEEVKVLKGNKLAYESYIIPIRKNYNFIDAFVDHLYKSNKAKINYKNTQNFEQRHSRSKSKTKNQKKSNNINLIKNENDKTMVILPPIPLDSLKIVK